MPSLESFFFEDLLESLLRESYRGGKSLACVRLSSDMEGAASAP